jgi:hypothetical protein
MDLFHAETDERPVTGGKDNDVTLSAGPITGWRGDVGKRPERARGPDQLRATDGCASEYFSFKRNISGRAVSNDLVKNGSN